MIEAFGPAGQRVALDMSTVRALVEGEQVQRVYVAGEPEPFTVTASYDAVLAAWKGAPAWVR